MAPVTQDILKTVMCHLISNNTLVIASNISEFNEIIFENVSQSVTTESVKITTEKSVYNDEEMKKLNEFHIIKVIVLSVVTLLVLVSLCKVMFGMFLKQPRKPDK